MKWDSLFAWIVKFTCNALLNASLGNRTKYQWNIRTRFVWKKFNMEISDIILRSFIRLMLGSWSNRTLLVTPFCLPGGKPIGQHRDRTRYTDNLKTLPALRRLGDMEARAPKRNRGKVREIDGRSWGKRRRYIWAALKRYYPTSKLTINHRCAPVAPAVKGADCPFTIDSHRDLAFFGCYWFLYWFLQ